MTPEEMKYIEKHKKNLAIAIMEEFNEEGVMLMIRKDKKKKLGDAVKSATDKVWERMVKGKVIDLGND